MRTFGCYFSVVLMGTMPLIANAADPVNFPDANLKTAVELELGVTDPTPTDMLGLTFLNASSSGIVDLTGLEHATNLTELWLSNNQISDISAVAGLTLFDACDGVELPDGCNDDACGAQSQVTVNLTTGQTYFIRVAGFGGETGDYALTVTPG